MLFVEIHVFYYYLFHTTYCKRGKEQDMKHNQPMGIIVAAQTILQVEAQSTQTKTCTPNPESKQKVIHPSCIYIAPPQLPNQSTCHDALCNPQPSPILHLLSPFTNKWHYPIADQSYSPPRLHLMRCWCQTFLLVG